MSMQGTEDIALAERKKRMKSAGEGGADLQHGAAEGDVEEVLHRGAQGGTPRHHKPDPPTEGGLHRLQDCAVNDWAQLRKRHKGMIDVDIIFQTDIGIDLDMYCNGRLRCGFICCTHLQLYFVQDAAPSLKRHPLLSRNGQLKSKGTSQY